jgi:quercetin dioxygenase-like cupin family protein
MRISKASSGEVVRVGPLGSELQTAQLVTLIKSPHLKVLQAMVPSGGSVPEHGFPGEAVVHCLQGRVVLTSLGDDYDLPAGQLLFFSSDVLFSVKGVENSSLLIIVALPKEGEATELVG